MLCSRERWFRKLDADRIAPLRRAVTLHLRLVAARVEPALPLSGSAPHDHAGSQSLVREHPAQALRVPRLRVPRAEPRVVESRRHLEGVQPLGDEEPVRLREYLALALIGHRMGGALEPFKPPAERRVTTGPQPRLTLGTLASGGLLDDGVAVHLGERGEHTRQPTACRGGSVDERFLDADECHVEFGEIIDDFGADVELAGEAAEVERDEHVVLALGGIAERLGEGGTVLDGAGHSRVLVDTPGEVPAARFDEGLAEPHLVAERGSVHLVLGRDAGKDHRALGLGGTHCVLRFVRRSRWSSAAQSLQFGRSQSRSARTRRKADAGSVRRHRVQVFVASVVMVLTRTSPPSRRRCASRRGARLRGRTWRAGARWGAPSRLR